MCNKRIGIKAMKLLQLIVEIKEEEYNYSKEAYNKLLEETKKVNPLIKTLLIDVKNKRVYCYSDSKVNNLIAQKGEIKIMKGYWIDLLCIVISFIAVGIVDVYIFNTPVDITRALLIAFVCYTVYKNNWRE